ncbi:F-box associated domain-containing protein [Caenorhabditis elegans]|uniref:F-box associated domain-containing protein n=1 Tax=Caenorhabditis elegans TaxID=6239 RepID=O44493_CAEEL|nr:F-box associated domain-containing protein [Caenorhabditis elegans]CCD69515.1 F-box associated domain-containing protein [Caenorhabditis elegans]|eukprot:NP_500533.1 Uncharacterized protein CELE_F15E6.5 [Caenorhabditis elegans]
MLKSNAEQIVFKGYPLPDNSIQTYQEVQETFQHNLKILEIPSNYPLTLNDLLIINCCILRVKCILTPNVLNLFIKHWMNGSNPLLKHFSARISTELNRHLRPFINRLLAGLKYETTVLEFELNAQENIAAQEVYVVQGNEETLAIITFSDEGRYFQMFTQPEEN